MDEQLVDDYLARIGAERPAVADAEALRGLQRLHRYAVPFENLSIHRGEDIDLVAERLVEKIVARGRGGFCYELNGAFAALLTRLGYEVTLLEARVFDDGAPGLPYDHLTLRVKTADAATPWLVDVGFGRFTEEPLLFDSREDQHDERGVFKIVELPDGDLDVHADGRPQYRLSTRPRSLPEFMATCWYHRTSPRSPFTRSLICSLPIPDGTVTLSGRRLKTTVAEEVTERELPDAESVLAAYREHFRITLDEEPTVGVPPGVLRDRPAQ
ncbi:MULTISPECIES: arylamine N-acetyltransferase [unclassified Streptomyces]|uniref:arylamine N-acetyltransferase family protein n=1 Tax=unclassified Streptomyces TaxID=2593676 RepID=UPI000CD5B230|nr:MULTISPECIES: arylamine N-acetyltransferase [unclassified Streptomyces]